MVGGEHSLKISAPQLLRFGIDIVLKIMNEGMISSMSDGGDCRTAPATPGLLNIAGDLSSESNQSQLSFQHLSKFAPTAIAIAASEGNRC